MLIGCSVATTASPPALEPDAFAALTMELVDVRTLMELLSMGERIALSYPSKGKLTGYWVERILLGSMYIDLQVLNHCNYLKTGISRK